MAFRVKVKDSNYSYFFNYDTIEIIPISLTNVKLRSNFIHLNLLHLFSIFAIDLQNEFSAIVLFRLISIACNVSGMFFKKLLNISDVKQQLDWKNKLRKIIYS